MTSQTIATTTGASTAYAPPAAPEKEALIAECIGRIITGRPLPEALRPQVPDVQRPETVEEGIARILAGGTTDRR